MSAWSPMPEPGASPGVASLERHRRRPRVVSPLPVVGDRRQGAGRCAMTLSLSWNSRTAGPRRSPPGPTGRCRVVPASGAPSGLAPARLATCCSTGAPPSIRTPPPGDAVSSLVHVAASTVPLTVMCCPAWNALTNAVITIVNTPSICSGAAAPAKALSFCCARATSGPVEPTLRTGRTGAGNPATAASSAVHRAASATGLVPRPFEVRNARRRRRVAGPKSPSAVSAPPAAVARLSFSCSSRTASPVCPSRSSGCAGMKPPSGIPHRCTVGRRPAR